MSEHKSPVLAFLDTPEVDEILRFMCFEVIGLVQVLRADGQTIKHRAEDEQSAAMRWMLKLAVEHGSDWRNAAGEELERIAAAAKARADG